MSISISKTVNELNKIIEKEPVDWDAFDRILSDAEDINYADTDFEETVLTEFLSASTFYKNGILMPKTIQHFLNNGYDVNAHDGFNGGAALSQLCWSSYDKYILEAAKVLLDAGAPIDYTCSDDDPNEESVSVLATIEWELSGAWRVDNDPEWANVITAYYFIIKAAEDGKDYHLISSYLDCIGERLSGVDIISSADDHSLISDNGVNYFKEPLVFWFGDKPLIVKQYTEFLIDRITVKENEDHIFSAENYFSTIIGSSLIRLQYVNSTFCFLDFDNGFRFLLTSLPEDKDCKGAFAITEAVFEDLTKIRFEEIYRLNHIIYAESTTSYEEEALAITSDGKSFLLFTTETEDHTFCLECIKCHDNLLRDFNLKFPVPKSTDNTFFKTNGHINAIRLKCGQNYLYVKSSEYRGLEIALSEQYIDPNNRGSFSFNFGKHIEFIKIDE